MAVFRKTTELLFGKKKVMQAIPPPDVPLQRYLDKFYKEAVESGDLGTQPLDDSDPKLHVPISIFAHTEIGSGYHYAGVHDEEHAFFSESDEGCGDVCGFQFADRGSRARCFRKFCQRYSLLQCVETRVPFQLTRYRQSEMQVLAWSQNIRTSSLYGFWQRHIDSELRSRLPSSHRRG